MNETECCVQAIGDSVTVDRRYRTVRYGRVVTDLQSEIDIRSASAATSASAAAGSTLSAASAVAAKLLLLLLRVGERVVHPQIDVVGTGRVRECVNKVLRRSRSAGVR